MTNISQPIIFFGTDDFSAYSLTALLDAGYPIAGVVTKPDSRQGRGQKVTEPLVKTIAKKHQLPVWQPVKLAELQATLKGFNAPLGVLSSYGKIVPQSIINLFTPGIINVHPSLLPRYRGPSPIESAIKNGDQETGVSIMQLSARMDAGPVYAYAPLELTGAETRPQLHKTLGELGAQVLIATLPDICTGTILPQPQDELRATYCHLLQKSDAWLQPDRQTAVEAERLVRAHLGFPKSKLNVHGHDIVITKAHVTNIPKTPLDVAFLGNEFLSIDELVAPSGKTMTADAFLRGYPLA